MVFVHSPQYGLDIYQMKLNVDSTRIGTAPRERLSPNMPRNSQINHKILKLNSHVSKRTVKLSVFLHTPKSEKLNSVKRLLIYQKSKLMVEMFQIKLILQEIFSNKKLKLVLFSVKEKFLIFVLLLVVMELKVLFLVGVLPDFQEKLIVVFVKLHVLVHGIQLVFVLLLLVQVKKVTIIVLKLTRES